MCGGMPRTISITRFPTAIRAKPERNSLGQYSSMDLHTRFEIPVRRIVPAKFLLRSAVVLSQSPLIARITRIFGDRGVKCLFVLAEEEVVGSVRHERLIAHIG